MLLRRPQLLVVAAERRAAVAADVAAGVEALGLVAQVLHQRQPHQRLRAGDEDAAASSVYLSSRETVRSVIVAIGWRAEKLCDRMVEAVGKVPQTPGEPTPATAAEKRRKSRYTAALLCDVSQARRPLPFRAQDQPPPA